MTDEFKKIEKLPDDERLIADLMTLAGERPEIPMDIESRVYHRVQQDWRSSTAEPNAENTYKTVHKTWRRRALRESLLRWTIPVGMAATAVLALVLTSQPVPEPIREVATDSRSDQARKQALEVQELMERFANFLKPNDGTAWWVDKEGPGPCVGSPSRRASTIRGGSWSCRRPGCRLPTSRSSRPAISSRPDPDVPSSCARCARRGPSR